ncbi:MAG TPA: TolC family protein [Flavobacterium sp.]|jgi:outer membrane protein TolC
MKKIILIICLLFAFGGLYAQESGQSYNFSLQQAIDHALQHNYTVINAARDIDIALQKKRETTATGLPQINAGVDYTLNFEIPKSVVPSQFFDPNAAPGEFTAVEFSPKQSMTARATLSQLLFDGSYIVALQASKTYLKYYENAKRKTNTEVREMVINSYGSVLLAEESIQILERNKGILEKTLHDTEETFKNGLIEEENVEQLKITLSSVNSNLNNARRVAAMAYKMLKVALGIEIDAQLTLTDKLDNLTQSNLVNPFSQNEFSVQGNIDYLIAQNFTEQRSLELKLQKSRALPSLAANLNFGYNAFDEQFRFFSSGTKWYNYSFLGATLNVPIFSGFGRAARTQQAKIALEQSKTQLVETEQRLKLAYENARSQYDFSVEEYATSKSNLALAERIERKQQTKFTEGLSTSFDFAEAQRQLYAAQQSYLQSMINVITAKASLENITNAN